MNEIKNQHQQVLWYLINWKSFSLKEIINDSMFYKFQTRLYEIEREHGILVERSSKKFINRFGRNCQHFIYDCVDLNKAKELFKKY